jgi:hypothetical protein
LAFRLAPRPSTYELLDLGITLERRYMLEHQRPHEIRQGVGVEIRRSLENRYVLLWEPNIDLALGHFDLSVRRVC